MVGKIQKHRPPTLADPRVNSKQALAFGQWLRRRRGQLKLTLRMLSHRAGLSLGTLSELERGYCDAQDLTVRTLVKLSTGYRVQITALLARMGLVPYAPGDVETFKPRS